MKLCNGEDIRCDDMGSWIYTGSKTFSYHFDKDRKVHRGDDLENHKEYQMSRQFFKKQELTIIVKSDNNCTKRHFKYCK